LTEALGRVIRETFERWHLPQNLAESVTVEFSQRLRSSLGVCYPKRLLIRLHPFLAQPENTDLLREVLCHEAAHIGAEVRAGRRVQPHGPEWRDLVRQCGYEPKRRIRVPSFPRAWQSTTSNLYEHRCPVCQTVRRFSRPQPRWKCADCIEAGLDGTLVITSRPRETQQGDRE